MANSPLSPDLADFVERLRGPLRSDFDAGRSVIVTRAPGRLDAFGGIIDYTGGTVLEMPLRHAVRLALQPRSDRLLRVHSVGLDEHGLQARVELELDRLVPADGPREYAAVCEELGADPAAAWVRYVAGAWLVLVREGVVDRITAGANLVLESEVPLGAGVSSSAALEMAALYALVRQLGVEVPGNRLARLGQLVENHVVGAPCGLMDQLTVTLGKADSLLVIRCQPDDILDARHLPQGVQVGAIHTGVKHAVGGRHYTDARVAAFMGHAVILDHLRRLGTASADADPFGGYLARVPRDEYETAYRPLLPEDLLGAEFLDRYGNTVDTATKVDPTVTYRVRASTSHQVLDNARTPELLAALAAFARTRQPAFLEQAGRLMLASHDSYRDNADLGAAEADLMVELAMERGPANGVYGAKITGGGCGGSVAILGDHRLPAELETIAARYRQRAGAEPTILTGSSDGVLAAGAHELHL